MTPPHEAGAGSGESRARFLLVLTGLALLLFLRRPSSLLHPQFWAEDSIFFLDAAERIGFWKSLVTPISGYLLTFPRFAAGLSLLVPLEAAPLACNAAAYAAQLLPSLLLLSPRMAPHFGTFPARALAAAVVVALPNSYETYLNISNSQWHLCLAALLVLFMAPPRDRAGALLDSGILALSAVTGPFAALLLPVPLLYLRTGGAWAPRHLRHALVLGAGAALQALSFLSATRAAATGVQEPLGAETVVRILSTHLTLDTFIGIDGTIRLGPLPLGWHILGLAVAAGLIAVTVSSGSRPLQTLLFLSTATIALAFAFPLNQLRGWLSPGYGPRYFEHGSLVLAAAAIRLTQVRGRARLLGVPLVAAFVFVGVPLDFFHQELVDAAWPAQVAAYRSRPAGSRMFLPVNPPGFGGLTLLRGGEPPRPFVLPRLPAAGRLAIAQLEPPRLVPSDGRAEPLVAFSGLAEDGENAKAAGAVYLFIDGKVFPAMNGRPPRGLRWNQPHPQTARAQFYRAIPLSEIGRGRHTVTMAIMSARRDAWLTAPAASTFTL